jgi:acetyl esterase/lipase
VARILSLFSLFLSSLTHIRPKSGKMRIALWFPKLIAGALSPFLAIAGGLGAFLGLVRRDRKAVWAGLAGAIIATRHVTKIITSHDYFEQAFGADWESQIPAHVQYRMLPSRWSFGTKDPPTVPCQWNFVFGSHLETDDPLHADIWQPPHNVPRTGLAIIFLHGSGWHFGDKDIATRSFFRHLAAQGHVIMDVAYTLAPKAQLNAMLADVKRAITWMKASAPSYDVNPERIVLMGGSAGGHLALLAAYTPNHPELQPIDVDMDTSVRAVVSYYGPPDLLTLYEDFKLSLSLYGNQPLNRLLIKYLESTVGELYIDPRHLLPNLLGGTPDEVPERYYLGSPINHVGPHCPPTLLIQGAHDFGGMMPDVKRLHHALCEAGVTSVAIEFPDTEHAFDLVLPKWSPAAQASIYDTERFLALMI